MIGIRLFDEKETIKGYTLIEAFPGIGLVGTMSGSYMIEKLNMKYIGYISSDLFHPIAAVHDAVPMHPARIYKNEKYKLVLFIAEFAIAANAVYQLTSEILAFARKYGVLRMVSVGGMPSQKPSDTIYMTSSDESTVKKAGKIGIKAIEEGVVAGVSASLLVNAKEFGIPAIDILVEVNPSIMDPKYAEIAITGLNKLLGVEVDLSELEEEAKEVEAKISEMMSKVKESHEHYANADNVGSGPSMYA